MYLYVQKIDFLKLSKTQHSSNQHFHEHTNIQTEKFKNIFLFLYLPGFDTYLKNKQNPLMYSRLELPDLIIINSTAKLCLLNMCVF